MKILPEHFAILRASISVLDTPARRRKYIKGDFPRADTVKDLNKRYRWDLLWMSGLKIGDGIGVKGDIDLYAYLTDEHLDTALRNIVPPLDVFADVQRPVPPSVSSPIHDPWGLSNLG